MTRFVTDFRSNLRPETLDQLEGTYRNQNRRKEKVCHVMFYNLYRVLYSVVMSHPSFVIRRMLFKHPTQTIFNVSVCFTLIPGAAF